MVVIGMVFPPNLMVVLSCSGERVEAAAEEEEEAAARGERVPHIII